jgi:hypothetical protein
MNSEKEAMTFVNKSWGESVEEEEELVTEVQTPERAKEIYWQDFYTPLRCDEISDVYFAFQFFVGVNTLQPHNFKFTSNILGFEGGAKLWFC